MFLRIASLVFLLASMLPAQRPPSRFELSGCTMECCGYGSWRATTTRVAFARPDPASQRVFSVHPNESVIADSGVVALRAPAVLRARRLSRLRVLSYPSRHEWQSITVPAGDTLYVLFESGEATDAVIWYHRTLYWSGADLADFAALSTLRSTWWARTKNNLGQVGWIADPGPAFSGPGECR